MPYGIDAALWRRLPADDQIAIRAEFEGRPIPAVGGYAPAPEPAPPAPPPDAPPPAPPPDPPPDVAALVAAADEAQAWVAAGIAALLAGGSSADAAAAEAAAGAPADVVAAVAALNIPAAPDVFGAAPAGGSPDAAGGSLDEPLGPEAGAEPSEAEYASWALEVDALASGATELLALTHPPPGTLIGFPYQGSHSVAFNRAGGSDNWQSENAVDVWLYPGTAITAVAAGTVSPGGYGYGLSKAGGRFAGYRLHLVAAGGKVFFYTHLQQLDVAQGAHVVAGQRLGRSGIANTVPHLHFAANPPFDPTAFVRAAYSLKDRAAVAPPVVGTVAVPGGERVVDLDDGDVRAAWLDLMRAQGPTKHAAAEHIRGARLELGKAVS